MSTVLATTDLLNGRFGESPTVTVAFDLYLNADGQDDQSVTLITGAPISNLLYDKSVLTATAAKSSEDYFQQKYTLAAKTPTARPRWTSLIATLDGADAEWKVIGDPQSPDPQLGIFELRSAGFDSIDRAKDITLPDGGYSRPGSTPFVEGVGGQYPAPETSQYKFPVNGGLIIRAKSGTSSLHPDRWSTIRLLLHDPKNELTPDKIRASANQTQGAGWTYDPADVLNFPVAVYLAPNNNHYRYVDLVCQGWRDYQSTLVMMIEAPILKYLVAYQKALGEPSYGNGNTQITDGGQFIETYYDPTRSYSTGFKPDSSNGYLGLTAMTPKKLIVPLDLWVGPDHIDPENSQQYADAYRYDVLWGVPDQTLPDEYRYMPHRYRNVDITISGSGALTSGAQTKRGHFNG